MDDHELRRRWPELKPGQRRGIVTIGLATTWWQLWMLWDLWRRPAEQVRGSKKAWALGSLVRPFGQIAYICWGRRRDDGDAT